MRTEKAGRVRALCALYDGDGVRTYSMPGHYGHRVLMITPNLVWLRWKGRWHYLTRERGHGPLILMHHETGMLFDKDFLPLTPREVIVPPMVRYVMPDGLSESMFMRWEFPNGARA